MCDAFGCVGLVCNGMLCLGMLPANASSVSNRGASLICLLASSCLSVCAFMHCNAIGYAQAEALNRRLSAYSVNQFISSSHVGWSYSFVQEASQAVVDVS